MIFNLKGIIDGAKIFVEKNAPEIMIGVGVAGMVTTTVLAVRATIKAKDIVDEEKPKTKKDVVKATYKEYIPAAITGLTSIGVIVGGGMLRYKRTAALLAAYKISEETCKNYKDILQTKEKQLKISEDALSKKESKKKKDSNDKTTDEIRYFDGETDILCFDPLIGRYFKSSKNKIKETLNSFNEDIVRTGDYATLNDFYNLHGGLSEVEMADSVGWSMYGNGLAKISFASHISPNGEPCLAMIFDNPPTSVGYV